jgi:bifunctional non-homologous end joining protein LigD
MLARSGYPAGPLDEWAVEPKLDGWRARLLIDPALPGGLVVRTRRGVNITTALPELAPLAESGLRVVLDGELVVGGGRLDDFYRLTPRLSTRHPREPCTFAAFDLLWFDGEAIIGWRYDERRRVLDELGLVGRCCVVPSFPGPTARDLVDVCSEHGVEGVVLKRLRSTYRAGERSPHWRKVKAPEWAAHRDRRGPARV